MLHIVQNRICRECGTKYKPPLPLWTPVAVALVGLSLIAAAILLLYDNFVSHIWFGEFSGKQLTWWGVFGGIGMVIFGLLFVWAGIGFAGTLWLRKRDEQ